jgi:CubicO group peptidase (beta-lactamase class C family)
MSVGQRPDPTLKLAGKENWVKYFLSVPILDTPGKKFLYNSVGTYMLSAIVQKVTGQRVIDYLRPRLFEPLGIQGMDWETSPQGVNTGGWGLRIKRKGFDIVFAKGVWNGKQIFLKMD